MAATFHPQVYRGAAAAAQATAASGSNGHVKVAAAATASTAAYSHSYAPITVPRKPDCSSLPVHGLANLVATNYPLHPASSKHGHESDSFRLISADQYAGIVYAHSSLKTGEEHLFPWLHGADFPGTQQAANFGYFNGEMPRTPRCVCCCLRASLRATDLTLFFRFCYSRHSRLLLPSWHCLPAYLFATMHLPACHAPHLTTCTPASASFFCEQKKTRLFLPASRCT